MGKDYKKELDQLPSTYEWALSVGVDPLLRYVQGVAAYPVVAVGSGGSQSAAQFTAHVHSQATGQLARAVTPLEAVSTKFDWRKLGALVLTASGRNSDIQATLESLLAEEPASLAVLTTRCNGPLSRRARTSPRFTLCEFAVPTGKDGYLATNSLLASIVLIARAYSKASLLPWTPPRSLIELLNGTCDSSDSGIKQLEAETDLLWRRNSLVVLYDAETRAAALDIESRFSEAALCPVLLADFRNFAHGRHYWLKRHGQSTAVLALISSSTDRVARPLLRLIPPDIPVVRLTFKGTLISRSISAVVTSILLAHCAGNAQSINPGCPVVPDFGRKMYRLSSLGSWVRRNKRVDTSTTLAAVAISRKAGFPAAILETQGLIEPWMQAYQRFIGSLCEQRFRGIILDYDGTVCDPADRFRGPSKAAGCALVRLLQSKLPLMIATGRGKSVRQQLQACVPRRYWDQVLVGYYNGSDVAPLSDDRQPKRGPIRSKRLRELMQRLINDEILSRLADFDCRPHQVTAQPRKGVCVQAIWEIIDALIHKSNKRFAKALCSDHSVDILPAGISKTNIIRQGCDYFGLPNEGSFLTIGDKGKWPGNDCELLDRPGSLSVADSSPDPHTCWNIAPRGVSHSRATEYYLSLLDVSTRTARFSVERLNEAKQ